MTSDGSNSSAAQPDTLSLRYAFLITQIGASNSPERHWADDVRDFVVAPALSEAGLEPYRSDLDVRPGPISGQMVTRLAQAAVVIADLTGRNPNVYYELGIAHALTKPVVVLIDDVTALPFDTQDERAIELDSTGGRLTASGAARASRQLAAALSTVMAADYRPNNVVVQAALARTFEEVARSGGDTTGIELLTLRNDILEIKKRMIDLVPRSPQAEPSIRPSAVTSLKMRISSLRQSLAEPLPDDADELRRLLDTAEAKLVRVMQTFDEVQPLMRSDASARYSNDIASITGRLAVLRARLGALDENRA